MILHICKSLNFSGSLNDIVQDIYLKFCYSTILQDYDQNHTDHSTKLSTYLYPIIRNHVLGYFKSPEYKLMKLKIANYEPTSDDMSDFEATLRSNSIDMEFRETLEKNESESPNSMGFELQDFQGRLKNSKENKHYSLSKRKNKSTAIPECTLLQIFKYIYQGYSNKEIARIYGVTDMSVTHMKHKLAEIMHKFGFGSDKKDETADY
jgi:DNA-directed RNA polymerase specialized sigma subunit